MSSTTTSTQSKRSYETEAIESGVKTVRSHLRYNEDGEVIRDTLTHRSMQTRSQLQENNTASQYSRVAPRRGFVSSGVTSACHARMGKGVSYSWFYNKPSRKIVELTPTITTQKISDHTFSVLSYNILATNYIRPSYYPWVKSPKLLSWPYRSKQLIKEICSYNADLLCLQEVEVHVYHNFLCPKLKENGGYDASYFFRRTSSSSNRIDGCAFFFRSNKFQYLGDKVIEFNDYTENPALRTDNIAVFLTLQFASTASNTPAPSPSNDTEDTSIVTEPPIVVVGNTHLCFRYPDARCLQAQVFLQEAKEFQQMMSIVYEHPQVRLVLCGDFNAGPASSIYRHYEDEGKLTSVYSLLKTGKEKTELQVEDGDKNPAVGSVMHTNFCGTPAMIDYIWVSEDVTPTSLLTLPERLLLPNFYLSSDHVALLAHLAC